MLLPKKHPKNTTKMITLFSFKIDGQKMKKIEKKVRVKDPPVIKLSNPKKLFAQKFQYLQLNMLHSLEPANEDTWHRTLQQLYLKVKGINSYNTTLH